MPESLLNFENYKIYKQQLYHLYEKLKTFNDSLPQNLVLQLEAIKRKIDGFKKNEFIIAIAGEVKAGKSTFINSLLKEEVLPTDVLQATNAIIEIFYSPRPFLKITYASGRVEVYEEESRTIFKDILKRVAAIPDDYRDIPTSLIDQYFLDFKEKPEINDEFIKYLEERSGIDNLFALKDKLINYTSSLSLDKIPLRIELGYPFPWNFEELRIVDMPGVNAVGGVQDISFSFIERANAVLFIHPIKPVESESFKRFVHSIISNKSKDCLFLILTHAAVFMEEKDRLLEEAKRIYSVLIPSERIFAVDSILKLIYDDLQKGKSPQEIKAHPHKRKWYILYKELSEEEGKDVATIISEHSGFGDLLKALESFIMKIPINEVRETLIKFKDFYLDFISHLEEKIKMLNEQRRDPEAFLREIELRQKGLENLESQTYIALEEAYINFSGTNSPLENSITELKHKYYDFFSKVETIEELRKYYRDAENELVEIVNKNQSLVNTFFKNKFETIGESITEEYKIKVPKLDLKTIEEASKSKATKKEVVYKEEVEGLFESWNFLKPWKWLKSSRTHKVAIGNRVIFDEKAFFNNLKNFLISDFINTVENLREEFYKALNFYKTKIGEIIQEKKSWLDDLKRELKSAEKIEYEILSIEKTITMIQGELRKINILIEDLK